MTSSFAFDIRFKEWYNLTIFCLEVFYAYRKRI